MNSTATSEDLAKAAEYDALATQEAEQAIESFERCGTDGFLSQGVSQAYSSKYRRMAKYYRDGQKDYAQVLTDLDGNVISWRTCNNQWGFSWILTDDAAEKFGTRFITTSAAKKEATRARNNAKKGVVETAVEVSGKYEIKGELYCPTIVFLPDWQAMEEGNYTLCTD